MTLILVIMHLYHTDCMVNRAPLVWRHSSCCVGTTPSVQSMLQAQLCTRTQRQLYNASNTCYDMWDWIDSTAAAVAIYCDAKESELSVVSSRQSGKLYYRRPASEADRSHAQMTSHPSAPSDCWCNKRVDRQNRPAMAKQFVCVGDCALFQVALNIDAERQLVNVNGDKLRKNRLEIFPDY